MRGTFGIQAWPSRQATSAIDTQSCPAGQSFGKCPAMNPQSGWPSKRTCDVVEAATLPHGNDWGAGVAIHMQLTSDVRFLV
jgi:hypothetical protein